MRNIIIGITDCDKYAHYANWIMSESGIETIKLSYRIGNFRDVEKCDGVLLTGGEDVHPRFYNKPEYLEYCDKDYIDEKRDEFELKILHYVKERSLSLLGICRGLQIANVFFGGTLVPDIPAFGKFNHSKISGYDLYHPIQVDENSLLYKIVNTNNGVINSAHHQSAALVAKDLIANGISIDGVIESLEWKHPKGKAFLLLVQWHPERMKDQQSLFTKKIKEYFVNEVKEQRINE